jgi:hypothetical protein
LEEMSVDRTEIDRQSVPERFNAEAGHDRARLYRVPRGDGTTVAEPVGALPDPGQRGKADRDVVRVLRDGTIVDTTLV